MSDLTFMEKASFEKLFEMKSGYVLDFTDHTFQMFVGEVTGEDILDEKYNIRSGSKANRLRAFWNEEPNHIIGKLLQRLLEYYYEKSKDGIFDYSLNEGTYKKCAKIAERLLNDLPVTAIEAFIKETDDRDFNLAAKSILESIEKHEPEVALDRLHTFLTKYIRRLCIEHSIECGKDEPLNSIFAKYVGYLKQESRFETRTTLTILKSAIKILEDFNDVRNNKSLAHDNPLLNYEESILIFNNIANTIRFIDYVEGVSPKPSDPAIFR